ncbi:MAG: arylsulfotransferase family protein [Streptosporangiaceae bacterium]
MLTRTGMAASGMAAAGFGLAACGTGNASSHKPRRSKDVQHFVSRPDLTPPKVTLTHVAPGHKLQYLFLGLAASGPGQGGAMIMDTTGELAWFDPDRGGTNKLDFAFQRYQDRPVLTWFQGRVVKGGHGEGVVVIADSTYRVTHTLHAHDGLEADFHELNLTPQGTALFTAFRTSRHDLSSVGGPADGWLLSGVAQEVDIATGKLLFHWDSVDHVPLSESYLALKGTGRTRKKPFDYFHINTIADAGDGSGDLIIGARNTWCAYRVSRKTGEIVWRLNGKRSDFTMGPGSQFYWQHDSRPHGPDVMTVFDDGYDAVMPKDESQSRALILDVDTDSMLVTLRSQFTNDPPVLARAMGNTQLLPHGGVFVGWGTNPYFSEFSADGKLLLEGRLTKGDPAYRSYIGDWAGHPTDPPAAAARHHAGGAMVYASWNGATEVASWAVLAGRTSSTLTQVGAAHKHGFETAIPVRAKGPFFAAEARDAKGRRLSASPVTKLA